MQLPALQQQHFTGKHNVGNRSRSHVRHSVAAVNDTVAAPLQIATTAALLMPVFGSQKGLFSGGGVITSPVSGL